MLRNTKKAETSFNVSSLNCTMISSQSTVQVMEKEIDNYTRQLEQDKRKFFRAQENFSEINKEYSMKNKQLQVLKSKKAKTQLVALKSKIKSLQARLDQNINSYNESLAKNNRLKQQINQLRKDKKSDNQKLQYLTKKVQQKIGQIEEKKLVIENKKEIIQKIKHQIIKLKEDNQHSGNNYEMQVSRITTNFQQTNRTGERKGKQEKTTKTETVDTQPLVKLRLRNLLAENKEKMKIIDQYKKNMSLIHESFEQIKQESGIQSLEEITKTFLKQQEQNLSVYHYICRLNENLQQLKDQTQEIKSKIAQQQRINKEKRMFLTGTPQQVKRRRDLQRFKQQKYENINQLNNFLAQIKSILVEVFRAYGLLSEGEDIELTHNNVQNYLSELEDLINKSGIEMGSLNIGQLKEDVTRYTKLPPALIEEPKQKGQDRLLEQEKLVEIAGDFWEKKKANRINKNSESID